MNQSQHDSDNDGPGMLIALIVILALMAIYLGYLGIKGFVSGMAEKYTDTNPVVLPVVDVSETEVEGVLNRVDGFMKAVENNDEAVVLSLSARDINILINHHPDWSDFAGGVYVNIEGKEIHGTVSMPISGSGQLLNGRYLNGNGIFRIGLQGDQPEVYIESLEMNGEPLPGFLMNKIRSTNLMANSEWDAKPEAIVRRVETFNIEDGHLNIVVGPQAALKRSTTNEAEVVP